LDVDNRVAAIEETVTGSLEWLRGTEMALRGKGALWVIELPESIDIESVVFGIYNAGVCVGITGRQIRIIPAATIEPANLECACAVIAEQLHKARQHG
jgi:acetylornithine/succinyldiaminopimelate/putrescine aminotransferase